MYCKHMQKRIRSQEQLTFEADGEIAHCESHAYLNLMLWSLYTGWLSLTTHRSPPSVRNSFESTASTVLNPGHDSFRLDCEHMHRLEITTSSYSGFPFTVFPVLDWETLMSDMLQSAKPAKHAQQASATPHRPNGVLYWEPKRSIKDTSSYNAKRNKSNKDEFDDDRHDRYCTSHLKLWFSPGLGDGLYI